jgi:ankyrin repeat protein
MQALLWIVCARRPLTTTELRHALGVELDEPQFDEENIPDLQDLVSNCCGLLTIDENSDTIRLVHYTAQEYFERNLNTWFPNAQSEITRTCITYLSFKTFENGRCKSDSEFEKRLSSYPLYHYASHHWGHHARSSDSECQLSLSLLAMPLQVDAASQALLAVKNWLGDNDYSQRVPNQMIGLHLAAFFGLYNTILVILDDQNINSRNSHGQTPLSFATENGHEDVVKLLLDTGKVGIDSKHNYSSIPLLWAAEMGHEAVVKLLLDTGEVDIESKDDYDCTPLSLAARNGHNAVATLLLNTGNVDVNSKNNHGYTPLSLAAGNGRDAVVELLLNTRNVDTNSKNNHGYTALSLAAGNGHEAVVRLLIGTGKADINLKDNSGYTPLSWAAGRGHEAVVTLLLDTGKSDINSKDQYGYTPLFRAVERGHEAITKLLLEHNATVNSKDNAGRSAVFGAIIAGRKESFDTLVADNRMRADTRDYYGSTALSIASRLGHEAIVGQLIALRSVDILSKDNFGRTPLWWAQRQGHTRIIECLLESIRIQGIDIGVTGIPLRKARFFDRKSGRVCDVCVADIREVEVYYRCKTCNSGDFDICAECRELGAHCPVKSHQLICIGRNSTYRLRTHIDDI